MSADHTEIDPDRIAIVMVSGRITGGAERVMLTLALELDRRGLQVDLVLVTDAELDPEITQSGLRVIELKARRTVAAIPALARYMSRQHPTVVCGVQTHIALGCVIARRIGGSDVVVVASEHNTPSRYAVKAGSSRERLLSPLCKLLYPYADAVTTTSAAATDDVRALVPRLDPERVHLVPNAIDLDRIRRLATDPVDHPWLGEGGPPVVVGIGRLDAVKGFDLLIRAFARVRSERPARLVILGEGAEHAMLNELARELGVNDDVDLLGFVSNPYAVLAKSQLFALTSWREGLPTVIIEAMALGIPVVATDSQSGPRELLEGGRHGRLVPVGDEAAIADGIRDALAGAVALPPRDVVERWHPRAAGDAWLAAIPRRT